MQENNQAIQEGKTPVDDYDPNRPVDSDQQGTHGGPTKNEGESGWRPGEESNAGDGLEGEALEREPDSEKRQDDDSRGNT